MKDLVLAPKSTFAGVRFVLTDMDETLTLQGRLSARTYDALERLRAAGVGVIPVTAAPAGWCDQMAACGQSTASSARMAACISGATTGKESCGAIGMRTTRERSERLPPGVLPRSDAASSTPRVCAICGRPAVPPDQPCLRAARTHRRRTGACRGARSVRREPDRE
jgi:hypothetical protein